VPYHSTTATTTTTTAAEAAAAAAAAAATTHKHTHSHINHCYVATAKWLRNRTTMFRYTFSAYLVKMKPRCMSGK
jgi:hypothetical protein